jgi:hypothetical protein
VLADREKSKRGGFFGCGDGWMGEGRAEIEKGSLCAIF